MKDKEVGELWQLYNEECSVRDLIRKLVEERADVRDIPKGYPIADWSRERRINEALRDFGIDPADFT